MNGGRAVIAFACLAALAVLAAGCGDTDDRESQTLTLHSPPLDFEAIDNGDPGPSRGDITAITTPLFEESSDRAVGQLDGTGTVSSIEQQGGNQVDLRASVVQFTLEDGTIVVAGVFSAPSRGKVPVNEGVTRPIVGGTGAYKGASGEVTQTPLPDGGQRHVLEIETDD